MTQLNPQSKVINNKASDNPKVQGYLQSEVEKMQKQVDNIAKEIQELETTSN